MQLLRLREQRERAGLLQGELADKAGVSRRSVVGWEQGAATRPSTARKLAAALGLEISDLMEREALAGPLGDALLDIELELLAISDQEFEERVRSSDYEGAERLLEGLARAGERAYALRSRAGGERRRELDRLYRRLGKRFKKARDHREVLIVPDLSVLENTDDPEEALRAIRRVQGVNDR